MTKPTNYFVISIMSRDRVGIVYEAAKAISDLKGDIADLSQTVLRGYFTMILHATFPAKVTAETIKARLGSGDSTNSTTLEIAIKQVTDPAQIEAAPDPEQTYVLTASGRDRIGFVATVSAFCAEHNINILDLSTKVAGSDYIMILLVDLSRCPSLDTVRHQLERFSQKRGLNITLQHHDIFKVTNEIN